MLQGNGLVFKDMGRLVEPGGVIRCKRFRLYAYNCKRK